MIEQVSVVKNGVEVGRLLLFWIVVLGDQQGVTLNFLDKQLRKTWVIDVDFSVN